MDPPPSVGLPLSLGGVPPTRHRGGTQPAPGRTAPPRRWAPHTPRPRVDHMLSAVWTWSTPKFPPSIAPATAIAFRSFSPAARWYDSSSHRMYGMLRAIGP